MDLTSEERKVLELKEAERLSPLKKLPTLDLGALNSALAEYNRRTSFSIVASLQAMADGKSSEEIMEAGRAHIEDSEKVMQEITARFRGED